jgi:hypothetical protein
MSEANIVVCGTKIVSSETNAVKCETMITRS